MGASHEHGHGHAAGRAVDRSRLRLVLAVTACVAVVELVGAVLSGSLALLADAGHMFTDTAAIVLALSASYVATLPATPRRTFGYHRAEILAALINAVVLLGVCGYLAYAGVRRLLDPVSVDAGQMLVFAVIGLVANLVSISLLATRREESLNMRGALLESAPPGVDMEVVRQHLVGAEGVTDVHDLHAWSITSGMPALSAHVTVTEEALRTRGVGRILDELGECVATHFGIDHATFQVEPESHQEHEPGEAHL